MKEEYNSVINGSGTVMKTADTGCLIARNTSVGRPPTGIGTFAWLVLNT